MAAPSKTQTPKISSYMVMLRYVVFYAFFFAVLYLVGMFGEVAES